MIITAYTFAVTGWPRPPFITPKRKRRAHEFAQALKELHGVLAVSPAYPHLILYMESNNDVIIAKNRLSYYGFPVSEEVYPVTLHKLESGKYEEHEEEIKDDANQP